jgi:hypothetical protein
MTDAGTKRNPALGLILWVASGRGCVRQALGEKAAVTDGGRPLSRSHTGLDALRWNGLASLRSFSTKGWRTVCGAWPNAIAKTDAGNAPSLQRQHRWRNTLNGPPVWWSRLIKLPRQRGPRHG